MSIIEGFDPLRIIKRALKEGGEFGELYIEDVRNCSVLCEEGKIEKVVTGRERGIGLRVIADFKTFYAYTNDISERGLLECADLVSKGVRGGGGTGDIGLIEKRHPAAHPVEKPPSGVALAEKAALVKAGEACARGLDKRVRQVKVVYGDGCRRVGVVNSLGEWVEGERTALLYVVHVVAAEGEVIQTGYESMGGSIGHELFDQTPPEEVAERAAGRALISLGARRAPGGAMTVVLSSEAGGTMIHEAVGHGLEADLAGEGLSVYTDKIGEEVASPLITVIDDGTLPYKRGSFAFDDEGTPAQRTVLVEKGVLKGYMYDRLSALKAGAASTGNGRRESYQFRPVTRMTNTMIAPGAMEPEAIVSSVDRGLFVKKMGGGQVNTVNGDFVFEVTEGYMLEKGKVGEPVRGATLTGNGPDILKKIDMVGSDLGFGIGTCGKDGQGAPVADAQPTLRIPEIVVGGEVKG